MKRIEEKVKDIVEVRPFTQLHDFAADPARTLESYHFTDITADLMANWIGRVTQCKKANGVAAALAGFRGVGKSHFLSTFAAILSQPELRARVNDEHVASATRGLLRRHFQVVLVRRGSGSNLLDELKTAVSAAVGIAAAELGDSPDDVLQRASELTDQPLILLFDTAVGRESRVSRDDGPILSEIAVAAIEFGCFAGVALDDDISGADGPNSAITASYMIDYLDPEHLFKIVDKHIFSKNRDTQPLLREIYEHFRANLRGFRWSEPRFTALYPLHPATLEVAPLIRLYIQDFALLGFASDAGVKILGRPADSLIGLDEMFDSVESRLRNVAELRAAFDTFDKIEQAVISKAPVQARLHAKLILKGLFLLSLDGQGATVDDIAACMMIFNDGAVTVNIEGWVKAFAESFPETVASNQTNGKYCFRISDSDDINSHLDEAAANVSDDVVWKILFRQTAERSVDIAATSEFGSKPTAGRLEWRGSLRYGEIIWDPQTYQASDRSKLDWVIHLERESKELSEADADDSCPTLSWNLALPTADEKNIIRRFHVLQTDQELRNKYRNSYATAAQIHSIALERIWQRVFISNGYISHGQDVYLFSEDIGRSNSLSQILNTTLEPFFTEYYPLHPEFKSLLSEDKASSLVANFFGGRATENLETQSFAATYAVPLGLAIEESEKFVPAPTDTLANLDYVRNLLDCDADENKILPLKSISSLLKHAPLGLTKESQHLVLASLVAQRQFEFVTSSGNRINHRSLDLQIIWNDIEGIARPKAESYSGDQLLTWGRLFADNQSLSSLESEGDRQQIVDALAKWHDDWKSGGALARFDMLPDEFLNTTIWRVAMGLKRSFGAAATIIESQVSAKISLEDCLRNVADLFSDSVDEYERERSELAELARYITLSERGQAAFYYVSSSEWTGVDEIDDIRRELLMMLTSSSISFNSENSRFDELWTRFQELYSAHYVEKHEAAMNVFASGQTLKEMMASEMWSTFQVITELPLIDRRFAEHAMALIREIRAAVCKANVRGQLMIKPVCTCTNQFEDLDRLTQLFDELRNIVARAMDSFKKLMLDNKETVIATGKNKFPGSNIEFLLDGFENAETFPSVSAADLRLLKIVCSDLPIQAEIMMEHVPSDEVIEAVLEADAVRWVDEPDAEPVLLNVS